MGVSGSCLDASQSHGHHMPPRIDIRKLCTVPALSHLHAPFFTTVTFFLFLAGSADPSTKPPPEQPAAVMTDADKKREEKYTSQLDEVPFGGKCSVRRSRVSLYVSSLFCPHFLFMEHLQFGVWILSRNTSYRSAISIPYLALCRPGRSLRAQDPWAS